MMRRSSRQSSTRWWRAAIAVGAAMVGVASWGAARAGARVPDAGLDATPATRAERSAAGTSFKAAVDRAVIRTVDRVALRLTLRAPAGVAVAWPEIPGELGGFAVVGSAREADRAVEMGAGGSGIESTRVLTLEPFLAGMYEIPSLAARVGESEVRSEALAIEVRSVLGEGEEPAPGTARGVVDPAPRAGRWWAIIAAASACGLVGAGVAWRAMRRTPSEPAGDVLALDRLGVIERSGEDDAAHAHEVSTHLRLGMEARLGVGLAASSTPEVVERLGERGPGGEIGAILEACDSIRFGGRMPGAGEVRELARLAGDVLRRVTREAAP